MAVSKRTRFEVLRRDNHTCRYCHATDSPLTVDHVTPVSLGGTDDPANLVAACRDCNAGKSSSTPDAALVAQVTDDAVRWATARMEAARMFDQERAERRARVSALRDAWIEWAGDDCNLPDDWETKVGSWVDQGLSMERVLEAFKIAKRRPNVAPWGMFAYMCGIVRNWIADLEQRTQDLLDSAEDVAYTSGDEVLVDFIDRFGRGMEVA